MASTDLRKAADKLDDAFQSFATDHGDGFSDRDFRGAYEHREEGYRLGEIAYRMHPEAREDLIEDFVSEAPESAQYLIAVAAAYRLEELIASAPAMARAA